MTLLVSHFPTLSAAPIVGRSFENPRNSPARDI